MEKHHGGRDASSVFYIPAGPDCAINRAYLRRMRHAFALGQTPPDFPVNDYETDYTNRANIGDLTDIGREMMGWEAAVEESVSEAENSNKVCENKIA